MKLSVNWILYVVWLQSIYSCLVFFFHKNRSVFIFIRQKTLLSICFRSCKLIYFPKFLLWWKIKNLRFFFICLFYWIDLLINWNLFVTSWISLTLEYFFDQKAPSFKLVPIIFILLLLCYFLFLFQLFDLFSVFNPRFFLLFDHFRR